MQLLKNWVYYNDVLLGDAWYSQEFPNDTRVMTSKILNLDHKLNVVVCIDGEVWRLGHMGNLEEYHYPKKESSFLNRAVEEGFDRVSDIKSRIINFGKIHE